MFWIVFEKARSSCQKEICDELFDLRYQHSCVRYRTVHRSPIQSSFHIKIETSMFWLHKCGLSILRTYLRWCSYPVESKVDLTDINCEKNITKKLIPLVENSYYFSFPTTYQSIWCIHDKYLFERNLRNKRFLIISP